MPLLYPEKHASELQQRLTDTPDARALVCYCAAWGRTCAGFEAAGEQSAQAHSEMSCVWVDIGELEDLLLGDDLEDLRTFVLLRGQLSFLNARLPAMIEHVQRLRQHAGQGLVAALSTDTKLFKQLLERRDAY